MTEQAELDTPADGQFCGIPSATADSEVAEGGGQKGERMRNRFVYRRISNIEFQKELNRQGISSRAVARIFGVPRRTTEKWWSGSQPDIPPWVPIALTLLTLPNGISTARMAAAAMIEEDNLRPEAGRFPYLKARNMPPDMEEGDDV